MSPTIHILAAWGEPTRPGFPLGETGKGDEQLLSLLPQAFCSFTLHLRSVFLATADSPCFHSHSFVELLAPVPVGVLNR
jgi:hypothetical protein